MPKSLNCNRQMWRPSADKPCTSLRKGQCILACTRLHLEWDMPSTTPNSRRLIHTMYSTCILRTMWFIYRMWGASSQHFNALLQLDPNNTQARIHRARAQYNLVCSTYIVHLYTHNIYNIRVCFWLS